jgi:hypothetical protein
LKTADIPRRMSNSIAGALRRADMAQRGAQFPSRNDEPRHARPMVLAP